MAEIHGFSPAHIIAERDSGKGIFFFSFAMKPRTWLREEKASLFQRVRDVFITAGVRSDRRQIYLHTMTCKKVEKSGDELSQRCDARLQR